MQAAIYIVICYLKYSDLIAVKNYSVKFHFIVIDQNFLTYAFPVSNETIEKWIEQLTEKLKIAEYHYTNKKYELPYLFCTEKMIL
jgi:Holliday junction resolvasome RuvABC DNA-binding subunit